jgi:ribosomal protein L13
LITHCKVAFCSQESKVDGFCTFHAAFRIRDLENKIIALQKKNDVLVENAHKGMIPEYEKRIKELEEEVRYYQDLYSGKEDVIPPTHLANLWYGE